MSTHALSVALIDPDSQPWGAKGSRFRMSWSASPSTAIVFVHGFRGRATATWDHFPSLLTSRPLPKPSLANCDLFFYEYDCRAQVSASSGIFRRFVKALAISPAVDVVNPSLGQLYAPLNPLPFRDMAFRYDHIVLCAHSLGALVVRRALLDLGRNPTPAWLANCQMVLFAPAHRGAHIIPLIISAFGSFGGLAKSVTHLTWPVLQDLKPGSSAITSLLAETTAGIGALGSQPWLTANVVDAEVDRVVLGGAFAADPPSTPIPGTNHVTVCKPLDARSQVLQQLLGRIP